MDFNAIQWDKVDRWVIIAMIVVGVLIAIAAVVSVVISIVLAIKYVKYNKKENSAGRTGEEIARKVLDDNGLQNIKVKCSGSILFGNSYSHFFKKVRLRRRTWKKKSVTSLAMAVQKSCLAILDKEGHPDMKQRIRMTPFIYLGPVACIPVILIGFVLDFAFFNANGVVTLIATGIGILFYALSFFFSLKVLKTEKEAQERALSVAREENLATESEIEDMQKLFKLYNIEYVNNMIISLLELILRILQIIATIQGGSASTSSSSN